MMRFTVASGGSIPLCKIRKGLQMSSFMEKMMVKADTMIDRLELTEFKPDPIAGMAASRYASVIGSMQKRHGYYLEYGFR